jgi:NDP-sugar pyrophosphorylase family protein
MNRERITITIKQDILSQLDRIVDGITIRSRSQAVEYLLSKSLTDYRIKDALVLAGGPKESSCIGKEPKFLLPLNGKTLIENVLDQLSGFSVGNFIVYSDSHGKGLESFLASRELPYGVSFLKGEKASGTLDALLKAKNSLADTFLVAYGDTLSSLNLNEMLAFHKKQESIATVALTTVSNPRKYGVAELQGTKVKSFVEKPKVNIDSFLVNAGYFIFEPEVFRFVSRNMASIEKELLPKLAEKGLLHGYSFQGRYVNINSMSDLKRAKVLM